jgi:hypothetical protein
MRLQAGAIVAAALVLASVMPLRATTITSFTVSDWVANTASGSAKDVDFTHIQPTTYGPSGYTSSDGFTITGPDGASTFLQGLSYGGGPALQGGSDAAAQIDVATPSGGQSSLFFMWASNPAATGYTVTLSDGELFNLAGSTTMFGISVSHPISFALLAASPGASLILRDVSYGDSTLPSDGGGVPTSPDPGAVPEPTTLLLLGSGLLAIAFVKKRASA